ncbi:MAG TPA: DEAD/DEAH box helicase, partial [Haloplasmataceae bacterium]
PGYIEIPHEVLSLLAVNEDILDRDGYRNDDKIILYNCIGFSHVRDFFNIGPDEENYLKEICRLDLNQNLQLVQKDFPCVKEFKYTNKIRKYFGLNNIHRMYNTNKDLFYRYIKIKGLLNRLDYAASAMFDSIEISPKDDKTGLYLYEIIKKAYPQLRDIQNFMYNNSDKNLVVIGSTGIGKTEACCLWMKEDKMFYTLPLKVAINAIYERLSIEDPRGYDYGYGYKKATLIHSDMIGYYMNLIKNKDDLYVKITEAKQFQSPLSVSTVDQLFTFVFKYQGFEVPLSTLAYSKVVIDELQMYDAEIVAYLLYGLKMITDMGGKFSIVTATLPKIFTIFLEDLKIPFTQAPKVYKRLKNEAKEMFRNIFNYNAIPREIYDTLIKDGTIERWKKDIQNGRKLEVIEEIKDYIVPLPEKAMKKGLLIEFPNKNEFKHSLDDVYICTAHYYYDEEEHTGQGLVID